MRSPLEDSQVCAGCQFWSKFKDIPLGVCHVTGGTGTHSVVGHETKDGDFMLASYKFVTTDLQACSAWRVKT
jgi:hypothetical protein